MNFLGSITPAQIIAFVTSGVTGTNIIWALFGFVGIGLAFTLGHYVVDFIYNAIHDRSFRIGGFYVRDVPFKGYNRFRSQQWNMEHMP